jgi:hypothetical protein
MTKRHGLLLIILLLTIAAFMGPRTQSASNLPPLTNLAPGTDLRIQQNVDVNIVLVGFNGLLTPADILAQGILPQWNGVPKANGQGKTFIGQRFDFHYNMVQAPVWFDNLLFPFLRSVAQPQNPIPIFPGIPPLPITPFQAFYDFCNLDRTYDPTLGCSFDPSAVRVNKRFITQDYLLDAAFVEKLLSQNIGPLLGIDVTEPTMVVLNWWGRPDYVDHIYLDGSEPDPDTGFPRGFFAINELAGYGPTNHTDPETCHGDCIFHRLWFYDISAGPMGRTGGWDMVADIPRFYGGQDFHDGLGNYRVHHPSDYGTPGAYRPLDTLIQDIALAGNTFVSELAYAAPLYPPALTPPIMPHKLVLDINRWNWTGGPNFTGQLDTQKIISKMKALPYDIDVEIANQPDGVNSNIGRVWTCGLTSDGSNLGQSCYGNRNGGYAFGDIATYFTDHLFQYLTGARDYEVPIFQFNVPDQLDSNSFDGYALSNYLLSPSTPTEFPGERQTFVVTSRTPGDDITGHGQLLEHEVGHHLGFSHPFNGYQCLTDTCGRGEFIPYLGNGFNFFSRIGNYTTGLMTYVVVNNDYSR